MVGLKGLAAQLFSKQGLAKEFDPEADAPIDDEDGSQNGGSDSEQDVPEDTQDTDHYVQVGKSKLRQAQPIALGLAYRGKRVSRDQLNQSDDDEEEDDVDNDSENEDDEEFDDPDTVDIEGAEEVNTDNEIDSDDALGDDDEELVEKFTFRGSSKPKTPKGKPVESEDDEEEEEDEEMDDEEEEGGSDEEEDSDEDSDSDSDGSDSSDDSDSDVDATTAKAQAETRRLLAEDRQQVLNSLSQAAKADADKGFAVRTQRRTFDVLLNMRIRMQKALSVANSLYPLAIEAQDEETKAPKAKDYEKAAEQAIELLQSIQSIRSSFYADADAAPKSTKRARDTTCAGLYEQITAAEDVALAKRRKVIDRWSARVQRPSAGGASQKGRFMSSSSSQSQSVTSMLDGQLVAPDRLVRRTRTPRSCAPVQAAKRVEQDPEVFDDADFYQLLLKELVDQRTVDSSTGSGEAGSSAPTVRWAAQAAKEAKTRKQVDRKASKGRKMRFNVHEKLQNFMTAEDRRDWEPEAIDRFFSSLFGQRVELQEEDDSEDDEVPGGADVGEGLRLF